MKKAIFRWLAGLGLLAGASIRVALSVGAVLENEVDFRGGRFQIYRHPLPG